MPTRDQRKDWGFFNFLLVDSKLDFIKMSAHEFGHVFGIFDLYEYKPEFADGQRKVEAPITVEVPADDMMRNNQRVTANDVEMIIEAWRSGKEQCTYDVNIYTEKGVKVSEKEKSLVIDIPN